MSEKKRCTSRTKRNCLWGSHRCGRPKGHAGKHHCGFQAEGTLITRYARPVPCSMSWGVR